MDFGDELRRTRLQRGVTIERLANAAHRDRTMIWRLEKGQRSPSREMVAALIEGLGLDDGYRDEERQARVRLWLAAGFVPPMHRVTGLELIGTETEAA